MSTNNSSDLNASLARLNVNAAVFVPSFGAPSSQPTPAPQQQGTSNNSAQSAAINETPSTAPVANNNHSPVVPVVNSEVKEDPADDWEANAEGEDMVEDEEESETGGEDNEATEAASSDHKKRTRGKVSESGDKEKKDHMNIVFIGHVDAGKSTIGGQILNLTGMVDKRTLEKYEREAKEKNRESWYLSWALDTNQEERDKGKTVEVGRAFFTTEHKHFTLLDAPGHKGFVPNMIGGACQADLAVLVISARKGEFETGFERGGQTREHAMLAKTAGVRHLVVLINKMDDPTVNWSEDRYKECKDKIIPYLKKCGFKNEELYFMPCSGYTGAFLLEVPPADVCPWYRGPPFLSYIDTLPSPPRALDAPFRMPIVDKYKDMGTVVMGKVEAGQVRRGNTLLLMPNRKNVEVLQLWVDEEEVSHVVCGESVKIKLRGVEEDEVTAGFVLCCPQQPCSVARKFQAHVAILETRSIICNGYSCVMHIHTAMEDVTVRSISIRDKNTNEWLKTRFVKSDQQARMVFECGGGMVCMETFADFPQMGRITLRDEGRTVAIGKILKVQELDAK